MKLDKVTASIRKTAGRTGLVLKKHSPEIFLFVGLSGIAVGTFLACKATLKVENVLDEHSHKTDKISEVWEKVQDGDIPAEDYTDKDRKKDLAIVYGTTAVELLKLYGPAITVGAASVACIIGSHGIMKKRNVAIVAAYKAIEESFNGYRQRVRDEFGEEKDYILKHGLKSETITETEQDENGKSKKVKKTVLQNGDNNSVSMYARYFDESSREWTKEPSYNMMYIKTQQNYWNAMLQQRGHVFLNEVYDALGFERTQPGAAVGWVFRKDGGGDNFIDFGIFNGDNVANRNFVNGYERSILLDFNVDGVIWDLI